MIIVEHCMDTNKNQKDNKKQLSQFWNQFYFEGEVDISVYKACANKRNN